MICRPIREWSKRFEREGVQSPVELYNVRWREFSPNPDRDEKGRQKCATRLDGKGVMFEQILLSYCWRWNGAVNRDECAYSSSLTMNADDVGIEGIMERPKK
ncbi:MAG: hypothetical protein HOW73_27285 [Polyangiaceae bacterium]|nr:hypothetical protein [Polyangiaceae bacterium]